MVKSDDATSHEEPGYMVSAPWVRRPSSENIAQRMERVGHTLDNPHALRKKPPVVIGSALVRLAEKGLNDDDPEVREVSYLTVEYFAERHYRWTTLEVFLGIRRAGGGLSRDEPTTTRNAYLRYLAGMSPWRDMSPPVAADDLLSRFRRYETDAWPREKHAVEPPKPKDKTRTLFWLIAKTGAPGPMPNRQDLITYIQALRLDGPEN